MLGWRAIDDSGLVLCAVRRTKYSKPWVEVSRGEGKLFSTLAVRGLMRPSPIRRGDGTPGPIPAVLIVRALVNHARGRDHRPRPCGFKEDSRTPLLLRRRRHDKA